MSQGVTQAWFEDEVLDGLSMLFVLGLPNTPAAESITLTAKAWGVTLWNMPTGWVQDADCWRMQKAFVQLMGRVDRFPTPKQFYDLVSGIERKQVTKIGAVKISDAERAANAERLKRELRGALKKA
jgi:hypothetical protein